MLVSMFTADCLHYQSSKMPRSLDYWFLIQDARSLRAPLGLRESQSRLLAERSESFSVSFIFHFIMIRAIFLSEGATNVVSSCRTMSPLKKSTSYRRLEPKLIVFVQVSAIDIGAFALPPFLIRCVIISASIVDEKQFVVSLLVKRLLLGELAHHHHSKNLARARALEFGHERADPTASPLVEQEGQAATDGDDIVATIAENSGSSDDKGFRPRGL